MLNSLFFKEKGSNKHGFDTPNRLYQIYLSHINRPSWFSGKRFRYVSSFSKHACHQKCMPVLLLTIGTKCLHLILHKNRHFYLLFTLFLSVNCSRMWMPKVIWLPKCQQSKKWIFEKGIGLFSVIHIRNTEFPPSWSRFLSVLRRCKPHNG